MNTSLPSLLDRLHHHAKTHPNKTAFAVVGTLEESISFAELEKQTTLVAHQLLQRFTPGNRIALIFPSCIDNIVLLIACFKAQLIAIPLATPSFSPKRFEANRWALDLIVNNTLPAAIFTTPHIQQQFQQQKNTQTNAKSKLNTDTLIQTVFQTDILTRDNLTSIMTAFSLPHPNPQPVAYLQFSSGSTGHPKGVIIRYSNLHCNIRCFCKLIDNQDTITNWMPLHHDFGLMLGVLSPVYSGVTSVLMQPTDFALSPALWLKLIGNYSSVITGAPNFALDLCLKKITSQQQAQLQLYTLKIILLAAEKNHPQTFDRFYQRFKHQGLQPQALSPSYGLAETTLFASTRYPHAPTVLNLKTDALEQGIISPTPTSDPHTTGIIGVGHVIENHQAMIINPDTLTPLHEGRVGEIWFTGPSVSSGYWNNESQTQLSFQSHQGKMYLRTGDLGFYYQGQLFVSGRIKTQIIHRGHNISANDIEWVVQQANPLVKQNGVCAANLETSQGDELLLLIECERHRQQPLATVLNDIHRVISLHFSIRVHTIVLLPHGSLLKTTSGKLQHAKNRNAFLQDHFSPLVVQQHNDTPQLKATHRRLIHYFHSINPEDET